MPAVNPCLSAKPTATEIEVTLKQVQNASGFIEFRYENQKPTPTSPSALAAKADTTFIGDPNHVKAWLGRVGNSKVEVAKNGNLILRCRSMNRRSKAVGYTAPYYNAGEYMWRTYIYRGMKLHTAQAVVAGKRFNLFPNVPAPVI